MTMPNGPETNEQSCANRKASMSVTTDVSACKHPDVKPIGDKAMTGAKTD